MYKKETRHKAGVMMRRSGRCAVVGVILLSLALFNIYSMMTMFSQHTCSVQGEKTGKIPTTNSMFCSAINIG